jgi:hypothetical protein
MSADLDRKLQLWRGDKVSGDKVKSSVKPRAPDAQRPRI